MVQLSHPCSSVNRINSGTTVMISLFTSSNGAERVIIYFLAYPHHLPKYHLNDVLLHFTLRYRNDASHCSSVNVVNFPSTTALMSVFTSSNAVLPFQFLCLRSDPSPTRWISLALFPAYADLFPFCFNAGKKNRLLVYSPPCCWCPPAVTNPPEPLNQSLIFWALVFLSFLCIYFWSLLFVVYIFFFRFCYVIIV